MQPFLPVLLFATLINVSMQFDLSVDEMKLIKDKYCGKYLSDTLTDLCDGQYNTKQKRNMNVNGNEKSEDFEDIEYPEFVFPFRSKKLAKALLPAQFRKRSTHGVASECCHKACTLWEMYGYCAGR